MGIYVDGELNLENNLIASETISAYLTDTLTLNKNINITAPDTYLGSGKNILLQAGSLETTDLNLQAAGYIDETYDNSNFNPNGFVIKVSSTLQAWAGGSAEDAYGVDLGSRFNQLHNVVLDADNGNISVGNGGSVDLNVSVQAGEVVNGNLLLTNHATQLTAAVGRIAEAYAPGIFGNGEGGPNPDVWGVQPKIGNAEGQIYDHTNHSIYWGMTPLAGVYERPIYTFEGAGVKGDHNCMWDLNAYGLAPNPNVVKAWEEMTNSTVLGTWNHVVDYCCAGIIDFAPTTEYPARILAVGLASYEWNIGGENQYKDQLEMFTGNCISYLK